MSVELPKDANGCEIPLDTKTLYYCRNCGSTIIFIKKCEPERAES